mmetsp:Transcript_32035/g.106041  ORF Transcript_32035/g.106041 Transcript_32035/m.106041 type:complete len:343 (-) Transcript_32035:30-1058(-)
METACAQQVARSVPPGPALYIATALSFCGCAAVCHRHRIERLLAHGRAVRLRRLRPRRPRHRHGCCEGLRARCSSRPTLLDVDLARELHRRAVDNPDGRGRVGGVEGDAERVEVAIVGEDLVRLLGVVGPVEELDPRVELPPVRLEHNFDLLGGRVKGEGAERAAVDPLAGRAGGQVDRNGRHGPLRVVGRRGEGELELAHVAHLDHRSLVARADDRHDGADLSVLSVRLEREGRPVRAEPELHVRINWPALTGQRDLHAVLGEVRELPRLARLALHPLYQRAVRRHGLDAPRRRRRRAGLVRPKLHARRERTRAVALPERADVHDGGGGDREETEEHLHLV